MDIRFHLDENVNGAVAHGLRLRGIDVTTTGEAGLIGASDKEQLVYAESEKRVIVTHDDDFLRLVGSSLSHPGIVYANSRRCTIGRLVHGLAFLWRTQTQESMLGRVEYM